MIKELYNDLTQIDGVEGIVIFSKDNQIKDSWAVSNFNTKRFNDIGIHYLQIFSIGYRVGQDLSEVVVSYEKGQLFAKQLPEYLIVVIVKFKVDIALVRLIINVGTIELKHSKKMQKTLKKWPQTKPDLFTSDLLDDTENELLEAFRSQKEEGE